MPRNQAIGRPIVLAIILTVGLGVVWAWLAISAKGVIDQFLPSQFVNRRLYLLTDGTPYVSSYRRDCGSQVHNLDGEPVELENAAATIHCNQLGNGVKKPIRRSWGPPRWNLRINTFTVAGTRGQYWYMIHDGHREGHAYFVGYDRWTCQRLGYLGAQGWQQEQPTPDECFPIALRDYAYGNAVTRSGGYKCILSNYSFGGSESSRWPTSVVALRVGTKVLMVNLREQKLQAILDDPEIVSITAAERPLDSGELEQLLAVRYPERIAFLSLEGEPVTEHAIPETIRAKGLGVYLLPDDKCLFVTCRRDPLTGHDEATLLWTTPSGKVLEQRELTLTETGPNRTACLQGLHYSAACPAPGIMGLVLVFWSGPMAEIHRHPGWSYSKAFWDSLRQLPPVLAGLITLGVILSWACVRRQRKHALPWTKTWAAFVFLFGVPGYLAYLCHRRWSVREECPVCHVPAPRDRAACALCDAPFPPPERKGIEIFA